MDQKSTLSALVEITKLDSSDKLIVDILYSISDFENEKDLPNDLPRIATILHQIYLSSNHKVRAAVINFCFRLEKSLKSDFILERYMFDYLVSQSLTQKVEPKISKRKESRQLKFINKFFQKNKSYFSKDINFSQIDDEKLACFLYIFNIIYKKGKHLPTSVIRALIYLYESDYPQHKECKPIVIENLIRVSEIIRKDQNFVIPSILNVFSSYLFQHQDDRLITNFLSSSIENNDILLSDEFALMNLFRSLSDCSVLINNPSLDSTATKNTKILSEKEKNYENRIQFSKNTLTNLLRTWPGLLFFGIKNKAIEFLMICLSHNPVSVIEILRSLLNLKENTSSVTDGYCGFLLSELLKLGLIEKLNKLCSTIFQEKILHSKSEDYSPTTSSFPLFSYAVSYIQSSKSQNSPEYKSMKSCVDCVNELLPFTGYSSNDELIENEQPLTKVNSGKFAFGTFLNSDAFLYSNNLPGNISMSEDDFPMPKDNSDSTLTSEDTFSKMIDVVKIIMQKPQFSINDISLKKNTDHTQFKWNELQSFLSVALPYDAKEADNPTTVKNIYMPMLDFLTGEQIWTYPVYKRPEAFDAYSALFSLLLNNKLQNFNIRENTQLKALFNNVLRDICNNNFEQQARPNSDNQESKKRNMSSNSSTGSIDYNPKKPDSFKRSYKWFILRLIFKIITLEPGVDMLSEFGASEKLIKLGDGFENCEVAKAILDEIDFYPNKELSILVFLSFLNNENPEIHKYAISRLRELRKILPDFHDVCFKPILISHIKNTKIKNKQIINESLNFLCEIISTDDTSLRTVCGDIKLIQIIYINSSFIFSILLSRQETQITWEKAFPSAHINKIMNPSLLNPQSTDSNSSKGNFVSPGKSDKSWINHKDDIIKNPKAFTFSFVVDNEIRFWMNEGNVAYYKLFNSAIEAMNSNTLEQTILEHPEIYAIKGCAQSPPHLFGQLSKQPLGLRKLEPFIIELLDYLMPKDIKDAESVNGSKDSFGEFSPRKSSSGKKRRRRTSFIKKENINETSSKDEICAIFFAFAQLGSVPLSQSIIEEHGIIEKMIQIAINSPSYVIKGALITSLSMFAPSNYLSFELQKYKWQKFRFGNRSCIIPRKPKSLFIETNRPVIRTAALEENSILVDISSQSKSTNLKHQSGIPQMTKSQSLPSQDANSSSSKNKDFDLDDKMISIDVRKFFQSLFFSNIEIDETKNKNTSDKSILDDRDKDKNSPNSELLRMANQIVDKIGKENINPRLKIWVNKFMSYFSVDNRIRDVVNYLFKDVPLLEVTDASLVFHSIADEFVIKAMFNQIYRSSRENSKFCKTFNQISPLALSSPDELKKIYLPFPEASLSELDFLRITHMTFQDFSKLKPKEQEKIRQNLKE